MKMEICEEPDSKTNDNEKGAGENDADACVPPVIRKRVNALRKLQLETMNIEAEFYRKVHALECEYAGRAAQWNEKRRQIVNGLYEPRDEECHVAVPFDETCLAEELQKQEAIKRDLPESEKNTDSKGIDEFWLTVFRNSSVFAGVVQYHDEPVLKHLTDVEAKVQKEPMIFTLTFHFSPNEYFTNTTLTKEYTMKCQVEADDPFSFMGPEIVSCKGCTIDWKPGKNVTMKVVKKKQKHKQKGATRIVSKEVNVDSFFDFFNPPAVPEGEEPSPETEESLSADFELGQLLREQIIPRAVLYYTGETNDDDEDDEYDEDDDDEESGELDDDESEEDDEAADPRKRGHR